MSILKIEMTSRHVNHNTLYQEGEPGVKDFCKAHGFDALVQIRGLERVRFLMQPLKWKKNDLQAVKSFEAFLQRTLTLPKMAAVPMSLKHSYGFQANFDTEKDI